MDRDCWQLLRGLLGEARELAPDSLDQFLERACGGDRALRAEVESLLRADRCARDWLETTPPDQLGEFRLFERLGGGGMGVVYRAHQTSLGRDVALKLIRADLAFDPEARQRFAREIMTVARLQHPGIVPIHGVGEDRGFPYFAMELVAGCTLEEALADLAGRDPATLTGRALARVVAARTRHRDGDGEVAAEAHLFEGTWEETCLRITEQLAQALAHVHERGILHRDIKPSNVMITPTGRTMLVDFGIARAADDELLTSASAQIGSVHYLPPERVRGGTQRADERGDIYSLGTVLYRLLTLRLPFRGESPTHTMRLIEGGAPPKPRILHRTLSWETETVCLTAMEPEPARRYARAKDLARDLDNALEGRPIEARRAKTSLRARRWVRRHPARSVAIALGSVVLVGGPLLYGLNQRALTELQRAAQLELDGPALVGLRESADRDLWPAEPQNIEPMVQWLNQAYPLSEREPQHRRALGELLARMWERANPSLAPDDPLARDIARKQKVLEDIYALCAREPHGPTIFSVEQRLRDAATLTDRSLVDHAAAWERAVASIRNVSECALYRGLEIEPQLGLVPLARNRRSGLWEFWVIASGAAPEMNVEGEFVLSAETAIVLVLVPGGTFHLGAQQPDASPNQDCYAESKEAPPIEITLDAFFISKYELTQGQYLRIMGSNPSYYEPEQKRQGVEATYTNPVEQVSFDMCASALRRMSLIIPTEAQWEYAARGGTTTPWSNRSQDLLDLNCVANVADEGSAGRHGASFPVTKGVFDGEAVHGRVGQYSPNPYGLYDMYGNIAEWCSDPYGRHRLPVAAGDGASKTGDPDLRPIKGGHWESHGANARSASREDKVPGAQDYHIGVRAARSLTKGQR